MSKLSSGMSVLAVLAVGFFASAAKAAPLNLDSGSSQYDVYSNLVTVSYDASEKTLTATGTAKSFRTPATNLTNGSFSLTAKFSSISGSGSTETLTIASGSLHVTGTNGGYHDFFDSTDLRQFGFSTGSTSGPQVFEFVFGTGSGQFGAGNNIGVILNTSLNSYKYFGFTDDFYFNNNGYDISANSNTFAMVPLPNAAFMGVAGLALLPLFVRRRRMV